MADRVWDFRATEPFRGFTEPSLSLQHWVPFLTLRFRAPRESLLREGALCVAAARGSQFRVIESLPSSANANVAPKPCAQIPTMRIGLPRESQLRVPPNLSGRFVS